jgi:hypothetical protein
MSRLLDDLFNTVRNDADYFRHMRTYDSQADKVKLETTICGGLASATKTSITQRVQYMALWLLRANKTKVVVVLLKKWLYFEGDLFETNTFITNSADNHDDLIQINDVMRNKLIELTDGVEEQNDKKKLERYLEILTAVRVFIENFNFNTINLMTNICQRSQAVDLVYLQYKPLWELYIDNYTKRNELNKELVIVTKLLDEQLWKYTITIPDMLRNEFYASTSLTNAPTE